MNYEIKEGDYLISHTTSDEYGITIIEGYEYPVVYTNNTANYLSLTLPIGVRMSYSLDKDNKLYYKKWFHTVKEHREHRIDKLL